MEIEKVLTGYDLETGALSGKNTGSAQKKLGEITSIFADRQATETMDPDTVVYEVSTHTEVP